MTKRRVELEVSGSCTAGMRIRLQGHGHAASLLAELNRCRQSNHFCDVSLHVGSRTFAAHRAVLACAATYFNGLFSQAPASSPVFSLEFVSPANFEKVLTFIYTGEVMTDLLDVGVLYELAERLGVCELVSACHATFPDLQFSMYASRKASVSSEKLAARVVTAASLVDAGDATSACSSAASCSSLSSSAGPSVTPTPAAAAAASSPLSHMRTVSSASTAATGALNLKTEDIESLVGYGQISELSEGPGLKINASTNGDVALPSGFHLKTEQVGGSAVTQNQGNDGSNAAAADQVDSSPQPSTEPRAPLSSSGEGGGSPAVDGVRRDLAEVQGAEAASAHRDNEEVQDILESNGAMEVIVGQHWNQLASEIIELSDDENFMEEEEDDEDDLVCVVNGATDALSSQVSGSSLSCRSCGVALAADPLAVRRHAESHMSPQGVCRVCGGSFQEGSAAMAHSLTHVGVPLFTCDMCRVQFCSQNRVLRHQRQTSSCYTIPQRALTSRSLTLEPVCAVCNKTLGKDFQMVRDHLLTHVSPQSLSCGVCHQPLASLCSLLWHALGHLSIPVFSCPHCARCFVERRLLDRHMAAHAEEAAEKEREQSAEMRAGRLGLEGPQAFASAAALQRHLQSHASGCKRKGDHLEVPPPSCPASSLEEGGCVKMGHVGADVGFSLPDQYLQHQMLNFEPAAFNGGSGSDCGVGVAAAARGKWYRCRYCGKCFAHSGEFTYHLRIHTGEKPYQCKVCLRFFRGRSTIICHLKTHAGALMYRCTVCGLFFSTLKMVSSHMELHKDHLPPDFNMEQTFMYNDHSKETLPAIDA
ncbi:zinc finger and BTB domain-containing protein 39 [Synchiropus splendidus]|uniref:zinc finger and BTB domain-containing protein 39 n=1 Tax=Synchiropus splendidus TaxID=270530 RepID=UPI00237E4028|nr:zinc finger and BTB domain-containing protein 39 [Synchiropus splendidus]